VHEAEGRGDSAAGEAATRLLVIIPTLEIGGAERQMTLLLQGLDASRYVMGLACCRLGGPLLGEVPSHVRLFDLKKRSRWDFPFLVLRLRRILEEFEPEFAIASMEYAAALAWLSNRFRPKRAHILGRKEVMPSQARLGEPFRRTKRVLDRMVDRRLDLIIAPSRGILDEVALDLGGGGIPLVRIPNAVDLARAATERGAEMPEDPLSLVAMGRFVSWKRFDLAIEAMAKLPRGAAILHLIGDGPQRQSLELLAADRGVQDVVRFHGYRVDPFPLLNEASIGILPSQFEPFGNVIIEMFSAGLPVVAFDVDYGPREIIRSGSNGILVREVSAGALAEAIAELLRHPASRAEMGLQARRDVELGYTVKQAVRTYEACFTRLRNGPQREALPPC
jgi:glycosyltransferase involved in cell wall biosynthesis